MKLCKEFGFLKDSHKRWCATIAVVAASVLLVFSAGVTHAGSAPAQQGQENDLDALVCMSAPVSWTDCTVTLNRAIPAGGSVIAAINGTDATVDFCSDGSPLNSFCGAYGNEAVLYCPTGCAPGRQFVVSALGTSPSALTHALNVVLGPTDTTWPGPGGFPPSDSGSPAPVGNDGN
jgi:hypothetical protein